MQHEPSLNSCMSIDMPYLLHLLEHHCSVRNKPIVFISVTEAWGPRNRLMLCVVGTGQLTSRCCVVYMPVRSKTTCAIDTYMSVFRRNQ